MIDEDEPTPTRPEVQERVEDFLRHYPLAPPCRVTPDGNGGADLYWKLPRRELLINIPAPTGPAPYYGDDYGSDKRKGTFFEPEQAADLMQWLQDGSVVPREGQEMKP